MKNVILASVKRIIITRLFLVMGFCSFPLFGQYQYADTYIIIIQGGLTKTLEMDAEVVGAGKHFGVVALRRLQPYLALGGGGNFTHVENIVIKGHAPRISLGMVQAKGIARLKTFDNEQNVYGFIDFAPGLAFDMLENDPEDSGVEFKTYWGPTFAVSLGTVMGMGMVKLNFENLLLDNELITWFSLSLGIGI